MRRNVEKVEVVNAECVEVRKRAREAAAQGQLGRALTALLCGFRPGR